MQKKEKEVKKLVKENTNYTAYEILDSYLYEYNILTEISKDSDGELLFLPK